MQLTHSKNTTCPQRRLDLLDGPVGLIYVSLVSHAGARAVFGRSSLHARECLLVSFLHGTVRHPSISGFLTASYRYSARQLDNTFTSAVTRSTELSMRCGFMENHLVWMDIVDFRSDEDDCSWRHGATGAAFQMANCVPSSPIYGPFAPSVSDISTTSVAPSS